MLVGVASQSEEDTGSGTVDAGTFSFSGGVKVAGRGRLVGWGEWCATRAGLATDHFSLRAWSRAGRIAGVIPDQVQPMNQPTPTFAVEKHAPERRRVKVVTTHCGCCCCCCCCLHTIGGLVGAAVGSVPVATTRVETMMVPDEYDPGQYRPARVRVPAPTGRAVSLYWALLAGLSLLVLVGTPLLGDRGAGLNALGGLFVLIMAGPAVQLAASLAHPLVLLCVGAKREEYLQALMIFLGALLGTLIGIGAMWGISYTWR